MLVTISIDIPEESEILGGGVDVAVALVGQKWSPTCLLENIHDRGAYVIHHGGRIKYVGKTDGDTMGFGKRLRRHFTESGSSERYFSRFAALNPPMARVVCINEREIARRVSGIQLLDEDRVLLMELVLKSAYRPEWQVSSGTIAEKTLA